VGASFDLLGVSALEIYTTWEPLAITHISNN